MIGWGWSWVDRVRFHGEEDMCDGRPSAGVADLSADDELPPLVTPSRGRLSPWLTRLKRIVRLGPTAPEEIVGEARGGQDLRVPIARRPHAHVDSREPIETSHLPVCGCGGRVLAPLAAQVALPRGSQKDGACPLGEEREQILAFSIVDLPTCRQPAVAAREGRSPSRIHHEYAAKPHIPIMSGEMGASGCDGELPGLIRSGPARSASGCQLQLLDEDRCVAVASHRTYAGSIGGGSGMLLPLPPPPPPPLL